MHALTLSQFNKKQITLSFILLKDNDDYIFHNKNLIDELSQNKYFALCLGTKEHYFNVYIYFTPFEI
jgi:hypothetical protein